RRTRHALLSHALRLRMRALQSCHRRERLRGVWRIPYSAPQSGLVRAVEHQQPGIAAQCPQGRRHGARAGEVRELLSSRQWGRGPRAGALPQGTSSRNRRRGASHALDRHHPVRLCGALGRSADAALESVGIQGGGDGHGAGDSRHGGHRQTGNGGDIPMNRRDASRWPARPAPGWAWRILVAACTLGGTLAAAAHPAPAATRLDSRVRVLAYAPDEIYRLQGYVGWHIDLEFESGETFVGLGAGDLEALSFTAQDNRLFLKPNAPDVMTNLPVLTNRRHYRFEYAAALLPSDPQARDLVYSVRFVYPSAPGQVPGERAAAEVKARLAGGAASRPRNLDYWYRGDAVIKPVAVSDDGVHTRLRFAPHAEQPAIFAINDDGS